ncbi:MAG TPA: YdcF family protein [Candidatus Saccharimonadales bacterium]|nr:YdcF family protein [Candidatus Saccharimonadales bacterium]HSW97367.1 YdcF family protein [Candidatus Saccharimonadales bacterium]
MKIFLIIISISALSALLLYMGLLLYIATKAEQDTKVKSDVILVLGGSAIGGTSCYGPICQHGFVPKPRRNPCLVARVDHAVSLYKGHYAPKILMSGGTDKETNVNEAETMKKIATDAGVPEADILMEKESNSTYENFVLSRKVLDEVGLHSVIIVTDPYHNARAELVALKLQYAYSLSPVVESPCWDQDKNKPFTNRDSRREVFALIVYKLLNKI